MAGTKGKSGRKPKSTAALKADGGYRACRHRDRIDAQIEPSGNPRKPDGLNPAQSELWDDIVSTFPAAALGRIDTTMMAELLAWFDRYKTADRLHDKCKAWDRFAKLAIEYGLSPSSRASLQFHDKSDDDDPFDNLLDRFQGVN